MRSVETIIIGGGFGGLNAAIRLGKKRRQVLLIDKTNHHLFQPLLYQVATASLSPADIASPIREILKRYSSISVIMDKAVAIDQQACVVHTESGNAFQFENLIVAVGVVPAYFGHTEWQQWAPGLKSLNDALTIRENMLRSFEMAELSSSQDEVDALSTFVVVGAGPTGVEMAGAIAEISRQTLAKNFSRIDPRNTRVYLVEGSGRVLSAFKERLSLRARQDLERLGVKVLLDSFVECIDGDGVVINDKSIATRNIIWAAGNAGNPLLQGLGAPLDASGRVIVEGDCSLRGNPGIFVIGDAAAFEQQGSVLPGLAPVAAQQGKYVARLIRKKTPKGKRDPFKYIDKGTMATIGKSKAVLEFHQFTMAGFPAWLAWCFIHLLFLVKFRNRVFVMFDWLHSYLTGERGARLIKDDFKKMRT